MKKEEALEQICKWDFLNEEEKEALETLIPELRESEDERIRKELKEAFEAYDIESKWNGIPIRSIFAWLEKQKDSKWSPSESEMGVLYKLCYISNQVTDEDDTNLTRLYQDLKREYFNGHSFENMFPSEKQKEQQPAEWSEDYREEDIQTRFAFYTYKDDPSTLYLSNVFVEEASRNHGFGTRILIAAEKVAETIGATTISLKVKQDSPANAWYRKNGYGYVAFEDGYDWLEKNLEYMKPNKQEWSEEDEACIRNLESIIYYDKKLPNDTRVILGKFLSNLRPQPQGTYKQVIHTIFGMLKDKDFYEIQPSHRVSLLNDIRVKCKDAIECAPILDEPSWKPSDEDLMMLEHIIGQYETGNKNSKVMGYLPRVEELDFLKKVLAKWKNLL